MGGLAGAGARDRGRMRSIKRSKIIAHDLGTGGDKASLYDVDGTCLASLFIPYATFYPAAGWHEQRPVDWWDAVAGSTRRLLAETGVAGREVVCLALSGQSLG